MLQPLEHCIHCIRPWMPNVMTPPKKVAVGHYLPVSASPHFRSSLEGVSALNQFVYRADWRPESQSYCSGRCPSAIAMLTVFVSLREAVCFPEQCTSHAANRDPSGEAITAHSATAQSHCRALAQCCISLHLHFLCYSPSVCLSDSNLSCMLCSASGRLAPALLL